MIPSDDRGRSARIGSAERALFSYVNIEERVPAGHPLRVIRGIATEALAAMSGSFDGLYASAGRPFDPAEMLLRALLQQGFYGVRSERQLMERLDFDLLFCWFVGLGVDGEADQETIRWIVSPPNVWDATRFSKNRERLLEARQRPPCSPRSSRIRWCG